MTWESNEEGDVVFEPPVGYTVRLGTFDQPPWSHLLLRPELPNRSILLALSHEQAESLARALQSDDRGSPSNSCV